MTPDAAAPDPLDETTAVPEDDGAVVRTDVPLAWVDTTEVEVAMEVAIRLAVSIPSVREEIQSVLCLLLQ